MKERSIEVSRIRETRLLLLVVPNADCGTNCTRYPVALSAPAESNSTENESQGASGTRVVARPPSSSTAAPYLALAFRFSSLYNYYHYNAEDLQYVKVSYKANNNNIWRIELQRRLPLIPSLLPFYNATKMGDGRRPK